MRDGGCVLPRAIGTEEKKRQKLFGRATKRRKTTEKVSHTLHSLTKVAAREDDSNERSRDIRRRRRLVDQDWDGDYVLLWEFHVSQP